MPTTPQSIRPPTPPPLPPMSRMPTKPSNMASKFQHAPTDWLTTGYTLDTQHPQAFKKVHFFFYGTLMKPEQLSRILDMPISNITLRPAKIIGYSLEMWGQYKALVDGPSGNIVEGMAYEVQTQNHVERLKAYETNAYEVASCIIDIVGKDGQKIEEVSGRTFRYAGDADALRDGRFDRKLWAKNMDPLFKEKVMEKYR